MIFELIKMARDCRQITAAATTAGEGLAKRTGVMKVYQVRRGLESGGWLSQGKLLFLEKR